MIINLQGLAIGMACIAICGATAVGCGSSSSGSPGPTGGSTNAGTAQTPPMGGASIEAWLATGQYKQWHCEPAVHAARGPSVHTPFDRVCSNDVLSAAAASATGPWPEGAAEVKEIYMAMNDATPTAGYAVSLKTSADSAGGANWYFYERFDGTLYSDGTGTPLCVGCHSAAGSDAAHTTSSMNAHDFVYTPVP